MEQHTKTVVVSIDDRLANPGDTLPVVGRLSIAEVSLGGRRFDLPGGMDYDVLLTNAFHEALAPQEATAITTVTVGTGTETPTYRIDGTRTNSTQRGIVIRNGQKIVMK